jgi:NTP pyrophosphatase (non-canonical NTP hydrolase)
MFDLKQFQAEHAAWEQRNFGKQPAYRLLMGVVEELGELTHALLKQEQGIRSHEGLVAKEKDAIGDLIVFLTGYCTARGYDLEEVLASVWEEVKLRDWQAHPNAAHQIAEAAVAGQMAEVTRSEVDRLKG